MEQSILGEEVELKTKVFQHTRDRGLFGRILVSNFSEEIIK